MGFYEMRMLRDAGAALRNERRPPMNRMEKWTLVAIALLAVLANANYLVFTGSKAAAEIFDWSWKILPSLATLVLGYVFGRASR